MLSTFLKVFFLNTYECTYHILKKRGGKKPHPRFTYAFYRSKRTPPEKYMDYSLAAHTPIPAAKGSKSLWMIPAFVHTSHSEAIFRRSTCTSGVIPSNTIEFLCFHNSHMTKRCSARRDLACLPANAGLAVQASRSSSAVGASPIVPKDWHILAQTSLANTHWINRWLMFSSP